MMNRLEIERTLAELAADIESLRREIDPQPARHSHVSVGGEFDFVVVRGTLPLPAGQVQRVAVQLLAFSTDAGGVVTAQAVGDVFNAECYPYTLSEEYGRFIWLDDPAFDMVALPLISVAGFEQRVVMPFDLWDSFSLATDAPLYDCFPPPAN